MALPTTPTRLTSQSDKFAPADLLIDHWVQGLAGDDVINGGDGSDRLDGGSGNDWLQGGAGNDTLVGGLGNDILEGGDGDDRIYASANEAKEGFADIDQVDGGAGYDTLTLAGATTTTLQTVRGVEAIIGSTGNDELNLSAYLSHGGSAVVTSDAPGYDARFAGGVTVSTGAGDDHVVGTRADDKLYGGLGNDVLAGNDGNDRVNGNEGNDLLSGGAGNDILSGGAGEDTVYGGSGDDMFVTTSTTEGHFDYFIGGDGYDTIRLADGVQLAGNSFPSGNVAIINGIERVIGSAGDDTINLSRDSSASNYDYNYRDPFETTPSTMTPSADPGIRVDAGGGTDHVMGTAFSDRLYGGDGMDFLDGGDGNDLINGGAGQDFMTGGNGNDTIVAGSGQEIMEGGAGNDRFDLRAMGGGFTADVAVMDFTKGEDIFDVRGLGFSLENAWIEQGMTGSGQVAVMIRLDGNTFDMNGKYLSLAGIGADDLTADMFLT